MDPRIAIIICAYNDAKFLINVVNNALSQGADEVIIVDDQSVDNSKMLLFYMQEDKRIKVVYNNNEKGMLGAIKTALDNTTCEYISWLACDDELLPGNIQAMREAIELFPFVDLYCCGAKVNREGEMYEKKLMAFDAYISPFYWSKIVASKLSRQFTGAGSCVRKSLMDKCFKDCVMKNSYDCLYMYYTMFDKGFIYINKPLAMYRSYPNSFGNAGKKEDTEEAIKHQMKFCRDNLNSFSYRLLIKSGIYNPRYYTLSDLALFMIMKLPYFLRRKFYQWFYRYNWRIEKL